MNKNKFIKALWPIWIVEFLLVGLYHAFGSQEVTILSTILTAISIILLPFIAGFRVVRKGGGIGLTVLGGVSISAVSILVVAVSYLMSAAGFTAFGGYILATLMFAVIPQALFGILGGLVGKRFKTKAT